MSDREQGIIQNLKELIHKGTDNFEQWIKENPEKTSDILKAHYQLFLTEIMQGHIFEYEEEDEVKVHTENIMLCKCGHPIEIVGTKWQHIELLSLKGMPFDAMPTGQIKYRERCYKCDCVAPTHAEESPVGYLKRR